MSAGNVVRVTVVLAAVVAAAGSATSSSNNDPKNYSGAQSAPQTPPPPQQMEPARALGLWRSTFGAVKIEADDSKGGLSTGAVQGVWVYQRQGQEVVGYFNGSLRGNVLDFRWQEPNNPPLVGAGYLVFDPQGRQYSGRWWSDRRDRIGDWNGWRQASGQSGGGFGQRQPDPYGGQTYGAASPYGNPNGQYGGAAYGYQTPQPYYPQQPPRQPQPQPYYPQQPPRQPQPQPYYPQQRQPQPQPYYPPRQPQPQPYYPQQPQQPPPQQPPPQSPPYGY